MRLKGKVALVTGAARGIGRGSRRYSPLKAPTSRVNDVAHMEQAEQVAASIRSAGRRATTVQADVAKRADVEPMIERVWKELGPIDILVNNAGIETIVPFLELTDEQWTRLVDVNLRGAWLCSQVFCRRVAENRKAASSTSARSRRPRCCPAAPTTRRRSSVSRR